MAGGMTRLRLPVRLSWRLPFSLPLCILVLAVVVACGDDGSIDENGVDGGVAFDDRTDCGFDGGGDDDGTMPPVEPVVDPATLGQPCDEGDVCPAGTTCVTYYGVAGPAGPAFKSCEISCARTGVCPEDTTCTIISDGPGEVCRPAAPDAGDQKPSALR